MSRDARQLLGGITFLGGLLFVYFGFTLNGELPVSSGYFLIPATVCFVITLACYSRKSRPVTLRIIGAILCGFYGFLVIDSFGDANFPFACFLFLTFGLPGGYLIITARNPLENTGSDAFASEPDEFDRPTKELNATKMSRSCDFDAIRTFFQSVRQVCDTTE